MGKIKQKNKFFKRNGGLLLKQQLSSHEANVECTKLFNSKDLENATDRFNVNRILGHGGDTVRLSGLQGRTTNTQRITNSRS
jgi:hypothetical protein